MKKSVLMKIIMFAITIIMMVGFAIGLNSCDGVFNNNFENNSSDCKHKDPSKIVILKGKEATCQEAAGRPREKRNKSLKLQQHQRSRNIKKVKISEFRCC